MSEPTVIPKHVLDLVETLRKYRKDGVHVVVGRARQHSMTWAMQILDAEDATIEEQKLIEYQQQKQ